MGDADIDEDAIAARTNAQARERVLVRDRGLIVTIASDYRGRADWADIEQAGAIGLLKAIDTYEPGRHTFSARAAQCVRDAIRAELGLRGRRALPTAPSLERMRSDHGFDPAPSDDENSDFDLDTIADFGRPAHERTSVASARRKLEALLESPALSEREREILAARMNGATQAEVASEVGINRPNVARGERRAVEKLRAGVFRRSSHTPPADPPRTKGPRT